MPLEAFCPANRSFSRISGGLSGISRIGAGQGDVRILYEPMDFLTEIRAPVPALGSRKPGSASMELLWAGVRMALILLRALLLRCPQTHSFDFAQDGETVEPFFAFVGPLQCTNPFRCYTA